VSTRENNLADKLKEAWFTTKPGIPLGQGWNAVAAAAEDHFNPPVGHGLTQPTRRLIDGRWHISWDGSNWCDDPDGNWATIGDAMGAAPEPAAEDDEWEQPLLLPPVRNHRYEIRVTYPDGSTCNDEGTATAAELAHRLRFEANLCEPPEVMPAADEVVDGAPKWIARNAPKGLPESFTAWNNGITTSNGDLIEDLDGLEATARAMLAAAAQAKAWRRLL
jgi:hypothetical protein